MTVRDPFTLGSGNTDADNLVDKLIGNAYQVVKFVALNMPKVALVSDNMLKLAPIGENIAGLLAINDKLDELVALSAAIGPVSEVADNLPQILIVHDNMPAVVNVSTNMAAVIAAPDWANKAQQWAIQMGTEVEVGVGYSAKYYALQAQTTLNNKVEKADLLSSTDAAKGAALVGFAPGLAYATNTVGDYLKTRAPKPVLNAGAPTTGTAVVGDRSVNTAPTIASPVVEWVCTVAGTPGTWRALSWLVFSGTTAQRPTLDANAVGVVYLDTTLAAAGKPITWTGTTWVDATGTAA